MSNYREHALTEFRAAGWTDSDGKFKDEMQEDICNHVLKLLDVFAEEGHSGSSAPYAVDLFKKLALFEPVAPLTGEDWEWNLICDELHAMFLAAYASGFFVDLESVMVEAKELRMESEERVRRIESFARNY